MNKYIKGFITAVGLSILGFLAYAAYDIYSHIGWEGVLNLIDFIVHGK